MKKRAVLYARSATDENDAIARQLETCWRWAKQSGYVVYGEYFEVASGTAMDLLAREQAIVQAESEGALLLCVDPWRLARSEKLLVRILAHCNKCKITIVFTGIEE